MTILVCVLALACPARGGPAVVIPPPPRGGAAVVVEPIGSLAAWTCIHNGTSMSGGPPHAVGQGEGPWNATGFYHGGLQMDWSFMRAYGRDMLQKYSGRGAEAWTPREQMVVAERARKTRGYYPWPQTARACGLI